MNGDSSVSVTEQVHKYSCYNASKSERVFIEEKHVSQVMLKYEVKDDIKVRSCSGAVPLEPAF